MYLRFNFSLTFLLLLLSDVVEEIKKSEDCGFGSTLVLQTNDLLDAEEEVKVMVRSFSFPRWHTGEPLKQILC